MWNVETKVIPAVTRLNGTISRSCRKYLNNVTGKHEIQDIQKTAIFFSAHIREFRKVLMQNQTLYHGKSLHVPRIITAKYQRHHIP
jgi:K+ transporter